MKGKLLVLLKGKTWDDFDFKFRYYYLHQEIADCFRFVALLT